MKIHTQQMLSKQRGFSILTGIILTIIIFASLAFFLAGQGVNASFGSNYTSQSKASSLLASAGYVKVGFDSVILASNSANQVTFDTTTNTGIFNPTTGGASQQSLDPTMFVDTQVPATATVAATGVHGYWIYRKADFTLNGVGINATPDYTMVAAGLKSGACAEINNLLHGSLTIPVLTSSEAQLVTAPTAGNGSTAPSLAPPASLATETQSGWTGGCYQTSDSKYIYIHVLLAQ